MTKRTNNIWARLVIPLRGVELVTWNSIMNNNETAAPVGVHFRSQNHSNTNFTIVAFERLFSKNQQVHIARERDKINRFELIEHGLNKNL